METLPLVLVLFFLLFIIYIVAMKLDNQKSKLAQHPGFNVVNILIQLLFLIAYITYIPENKIIFDT